MSFSAWFGFGDLCHNCPLQCTQAKLTGIMLKGKTLSWETLISVPLLSWVLGNISDVKRRVPILHCRCQGHNHPSKVFSTSQGSERDPNKCYDEEQKGY